MLAGLGRAYLGTRDAGVIERLLRTGRHGKAAERFCARFGERCFPLGYPWTGGGAGRLLVEVTSGIQHEGYGETGKSWATCGRSGQCSCCPGR